MRWVKFFLSFLCTAALLYILLFPIGPLIFPLGNFISPFEGFWKNGKTTQEQILTDISSEDLIAPVEVLFDDREVPHIFAQNDHDLAYVQGYVTAQHRLWQMEFQVMAAAGRLTEVVPSNLQEGAFRLDQQNRRMGMTYAAERTRDFLQQNDTIWSLLSAYADGVNAYVDQLEDKDLPIEYKVLNYKPEHWSVYKTCLLLKYMANSLAARNDDIEHTNALNLWGKPTFDSIYPERPYEASPIIPIGTRWNFRVPRYLRPKTPVEYTPDSMLIAAKLAFQPDRIMGSNNWAVSAEKSSTGSPILAGDPHLGLTLPAIWYEVQLNTPEQNVYGVSLPGAPAVIIGFNDSIAWSPTNAGRDVMDFYRIQFRDDKKQEYLHDGQWLKTTQRIEEFRFKGVKTVYDTVHYTHMGPVMFDENYGEQPVPLAVRWLAHDPSMDAMAFYKLNRANNYEDYVDALSYYVCPAQNFVFASVSGDIAIWQQGRFIKKWPEQGKFVLDGSDPQHMWREYIPTEHNPHILNPPRGFVSSANQHPVDLSYPYYYRGGFEAYRNRRINQLLTYDDEVSIEDMKNYQLDNKGLFAEELLPLLLSELDTLALTGTKKQAYRMLAAWDHFYEKDAIAPTMYEAWYRNLYRGIWRDEFEAQDIALDYPSKQTTIGILLKQARFSFYDNITTDSIEDRNTLINQSFTQTIEELLEKDQDMANWGWARTKSTEIPHLGRLGPFGRIELPIGGNRNILNAVGKTHGPSWRMVVSMEQKVRAWAVYPGGQSGHPGSSNYDSFVDDWVEGNYYELNFLQGPDTNNSTIQFSQSFSPPSNQ